MLLIPFVVIPLIEIALFIVVGERLGLGWTLLIVLGTAILGAQLVGAQGRAVWQRTRAAMLAGQFPGAELAHGAMVLFGGALLLTPGFFTDGVGLLLMVPPVRESLRRYAQSRLRSSDGVIDIEP